MHHPTSVYVTERFHIRGDVGSSVFPGWIARHAARLGVQSRVIASGTDDITLILHGAPELLDAMAVGCSLGPQEVWVDEIVRTVENTDQIVNGPSVSG